MYLVREVRATDLDAILELAGHLQSAGFVDSFNLPNNREALRGQIERSVNSFSSDKVSKSEALYLFVLEDLVQKKVLGTSLVFGKHGTPDSPHTYLKVFQKKHRDSSLHIEKEHKLLRFEYDSDGPSEIGGLILHPDYRGLPLSLGKFLSYSRFMYIALHLERFEREIMAELLPPFNNSGSNDLWEAFGRRFTGLDYSSADRLSRTNRDFIKNLFPQEDIYVCLLSAEAQKIIGETGPSQRAVKHMLEKIGFAYLDAVDPFDGGPHFGAKIKEITLIKRKKLVSLSSTRLTTAGNLALIGYQGSKGFGCLWVHHRLDENQIELTEEAVAILKKADAPIDKLHLITPV